MTDLLQYLPNLVLLDDQRIFDEYQKLAIYRKYNGKCANPYNNPNCQGDCPWDNCQFDHILPWSAGGKTTVSNGQLLCPDCNRKKGARIT
jgi:5-methylcytosine-specific restriction endonuclease McrA